MSNRLRDYQKGTDEKNWSATKKIKNYSLF